ncbi:MAG: thioredoxin family protein [Anaerolineae bacterium]|jgi:thioredoxin-related protein
MAKPVVDGLERELKGSAQVLRINVMDRTGLALAQEYHVRAVPTFIVFDGKGQVVYAQAGLPDRAAIRAAVARSQEPE